jgi:hypothetical protein
MSSYMDSFTNDVWATVKPFTLLSVQRIQYNVQSVDEIVKKNIPGDIVEIGVYKGAASCL